MNFNSIKIGIAGAIGAIGGGITYLLGGWSDDLITLIILMSADFLTGLIVAGIFKKSGKTATGTLESKACLKGLCRKCMMLLCVLIANRLDVAIGVEYIRTATVIGFIVNEEISILENAGLMGVPIPAVVTNEIEILKKKEDEENKK